jgi:hypothetical protein
LVLRKRFGIGKPRTLQGLRAGLLRLIFAYWARLRAWKGALPGWAMAFWRNEGRVLARFQVVQHLKLA